MAEQKAENPVLGDQSVADLGWWRIHAQLVEAAVLLVVARLLIRFVRFGRWRNVLGRVAPQAGVVLPAAESNGIDATYQEAGTLDRYLSRVVDRAALRMPFEYRCLPRAAALHWMLTRRGRPTMLVIGVLPGPRRGQLDDLHAWVELGGEVLIGSSPEPFAVLLRLQK
ncbi:lasso peptide biosynthesis B2 protein [Novosphingobium sp.]|uniref:lasso peptide biosynthesis B2 protein n=1 Tax=Novosphingobium sp. TaxID=1874826 RepID=UPI0025EC3EC2|nr:lasso peptide biosynthesis B2 protein [Novosphingobium sp.]